MKKIPKGLVILLAVWMIIYHLTCFYFIGTFVSEKKEDKTMLDLPEYCTDDYNYVGGFQDIQEYGKFYYHGVGTEILDKSEYLAEITDDNISEVRKFTNKFEKHRADSLEYDFESDIIETGDYFYIKNKIKEVDSFYVYYFDVEAQTLYFMHVKW